MPIKVTCSNCGGVLHAPDDAGGKRGRCPTCGNVLPIPLDAPKVSSSGGAAPGPAAATDAPPASGKARPGSFGDISLPVPSTKASQPMTVPPTIPPRASVPSLADPKPDPRRASATIPPPPSFDPPKTKSKSKPVRTTDPFARAAAPPGDEVTEGVIRSWKRARGGLWWVRSAIVLLLIPALVLPAMVLYQQLVGPLSFIPAEGFIKLKGINGPTEFLLITVAVPVLLGLLCLWFGRLGFSRVPRRAYAKGPALLASFASFLTFGGVLALIFPVIALLVDNGQFEKIYDTQSSEGIIQRFGLAAILVGVVLGEFWFSNAVGRVGAALQDDRTAARATRYQLVFGLLVGLVLFTGSLIPAFPFDPTFKVLATDLNRLVERGWLDQGQQLWDQLGTNKLVAMNGAVIVGVLIFGFGYLRMVGAARAAIREWVTQNELP